LRAPQVTLLLVAFELAQPKVSGVFTCCISSREGSCYIVATSIAMDIEYLTAEE
jgi:hypothetical protein